MTTSVASAAPSDGRTGDAFARRVGRLLRAARLSAGLSLEQAARLCIGVSPVRLGAWERGELPIPVSRLDALVTAYGLDTAALLMEAAEGR